MTTPERVELSLIVPAVLATWLLGNWLPQQLTLGHLLLTASALLLGQSLLRDLTILARARLADHAPPGPVRRARCLCLESLVGAGGVALGILIALTVTRSKVPMSAGGWTLVTSITLTSGFLLKDLVLTWWPVRLRRDPDHMNIIVTLRD